MDTSFNITFIEVYGDKEHHVECRRFSNQLAHQSIDAEVAVLTENSVLRLYFEAPLGSKLYMDGLDQLEEHFVHEDEYGFYIRPGRTAYPLFTPTENRKVYPFIPGMYSLMLHLNDGTVLETSVKVKAKRITENQHMTMIEEIEQMMETLVSEPDATEQSHRAYARSLFGENDYESALMILEEQQKLKQLLWKIESSPYFQMADGENIYGQAYLEPVVAYDTVENRQLKKTLTVLFSRIRQLNHSIRKSFQLDETGRKMAKELSQLAYQLLSCVQSSWLRHVRDVEFNWQHAPYYTNPYAQQFYQLSQEIMRKKSTKRLYLPLQLTNKRSDVLYELWGFLKVVAYLKETMDFKVVHHQFHIRRENSTSERSRFIELEKEQVRIRLFYDAKIPNRKEKLSAHDTMYTMSNNTPDCRLDVWEDGLYTGSLIIDFKYRKKQYLWNEAALEQEKPSTVMRQLSAYATSMRSDAMLLNGQNNRLIDAAPVHEVWAVYPMKYENSDANYEKNDYLIRFIDLSPGADHQHFKQLLKQSIESMVT